MLNIPILQAGKPRPERSVPREPDHEAGGGPAAHLCPKLTGPALRALLPVPCPPRAPVPACFVSEAGILVKWPEARTWVLWGNNSISMWVQTRPVLPLSV